MITFDVPWLSKIFMQTQGERIIINRWFSMYRFKKQPIQIVLSHNEKKKINKKN